MSHPVRLSSKKFYNSVFLPTTSSILLVLISQSKRRHQCVHISKPTFVCSIEKERQKPRIEVNLICFLKTKYIFVSRGMRAVNRRWYPCISAICCCADHYIFQTLYLEDVVVVTAWRPRKTTGKKIILKTDGQEDDWLGDRDRKKLSRTADYLFKFWREGGKISYVMKKA